MTASANGSHGDSQSGSHSGSPSGSQGGSPSTSHGGSHGGSKSGAPSNDSAFVVELRGVVKNYGGLRPLRVASLDVRVGERVAIEGFDRITAELFVNLLNGAVLPDEGDVRVMGQSTRDIDNSDEWLESLDRFGLVTDRAVLLGGSPIAHNLALPFSLEIDPMPDDVRAQVMALAREVEMDEAQLEPLTGNAGPAMQMRVHLARALATDPRVLLLEHPTVSLPRDAVAAFAGLVRRVSERRGLAVIALTGDKEFADEMAETALALQPGTGKLTSTRGWRRWLNVGR